jgi:hypothetical protein
MDQRDRQVGLFGDFLDRVGHGKFVEWRADEESESAHTHSMSHAWEPQRVWVRHSCRASLRGATISLKRGATM